MTAITLRQQQMAEIHALGEALVQSGYFHTRGVDSIAQAAVAVIAGRELGLGPIEALRSFHFTSQGVQPTAELLSRLVRRHPRYDYTVQTLNDEVCTLSFYDDECGEGVELISTFTIKDAERAGLTRSENWRKYPRNMLFSRAMTNGVAWYAPDVIDALSEGAVTPSDAPIPGETPVGAPSIAPTIEGPESVVRDDGADTPSLGAGADSESSVARTAVTIALGEGATERDEAQQIGVSPSLAQGETPTISAPAAEQSEGADVGADRGQANGADGAPSGYTSALWAELKQYAPSLNKQQTAINKANGTKYGAGELRKATNEQLERAIDLVRAVA